MDGPDDENPPLGWPKMISRRPRRKGYSSLTSNYTADWVWGRGQEGSRFDRFSTTASRQRTPYSEISAIGPPCAFLDDRYIHGRSTRNAAPSVRQTWTENLDTPRTRPRPRLEATKKRVEENCLKREAAVRPPIEAAPPIQKHKLTPRE
jgi:hypothetical protein